MAGRDRELARVMLLDGAPAGGGRLVLCPGENQGCAGSQKIAGTRMVRQ